MSAGSIVAIVLGIVFFVYLVMIVAVGVFIFLAGAVNDQADETATAIPTSEIEYQDRDTG